MNPEDQKQKLLRFFGSGVGTRFGSFVSPITRKISLIPKRSIPQQIVSRLQSSTSSRMDDGITTTQRDVSSLGKVTLNLEQTKNNLERILQVISEDYKNTQEQNKKEAEEYRKRIANRGRIFGKKELGDRKTDLLGGIKKYVGSFFSGAGGAIRGLAAFNLLEAILNKDPKKAISALLGIGMTYLPAIGGLIGLSVAKSLGKRLLGIGGARAAAGGVRGAAGLVEGAGSLGKLGKFGKFGGKAALIGGGIALGSQLFKGSGQQDDQQQRLEDLTQEQKGMVGQQTILSVPQDDLKRFEQLNNKFEKALDLLLGKQKESQTPGGGGGSPTPTPTPTSPPGSIDPGSVSPTGTTQSGKASFYGGPTDPYWQGRTTASGEKFDENAMTAASNTLPLGSYARVTNPQNGKQVVVKINDTGGFGKLGRILDLSYGAMKALGGIQSGVIPVQIESVTPGKSSITSIQSLATSSTTRTIPAPRAGGPTILPMAVPQQTTPQQSSAAVGNNDIVPSIDTTYPENFLALYSKLIYQIV
jgi:rare lipoprotein A